MYEEGGTGICITYTAFGVHVSWRRGEKLRVGAICVAEGCILFGDSAINEARTQKKIK